ncbi:hypothetical protein [Vibrio cionasavignyae]|uniref:hypothetical protein n=1 Tax=Vibrio cionasavignyae TaxID=2910252 RepID=UPI003D0FD54F
MKKIKLLVTFACLFWVVGSINGCSKAAPTPEWKLFKGDYQWQLFMPISAVPLQNTSTPTKSLYKAYDQEIKRWVDNTLYSCFEYKSRFNDCQFTEYKTWNLCDASYQKSIYFGYGYDRLVSVLNDYYVNGVHQASYASLLEYNGKKRWHDTTVILGPRVHGARITRISEFNQDCTVKIGMTVEAVMNWEYAYIDKKNQKTIYYEPADDRIEYEISRNYTAHKDMFAPLSEKQLKDYVIHTKNKSKSINTSGYRYHAIKNLDIVAKRNNQKYAQLSSTYLHKLDSLYSQNDPEMYDGENVLITLNNSVVGATNTALGVVAEVGSAYAANSSSYSSSSSGGAGKSLDQMMQEQRLLLNDAVQKSQVRSTKTGMQSNVSTSVASTHSPSKNTSSKSTPVVVSSASKSTTNNHSVARNSKSSASTKSVSAKTSMDTGKSKKVEEKKRRAFAVLWRDKQNENWLVDGPIQKGLTEYASEREALDIACPGSDTEFRYMETFQGYRVYQCTGRPLESWDRDIPQIYALPGKFHL